MILSTDRRKMHCLDGTKDLIKGLLMSANRVQADMQNNALDFKKKIGKNGSKVDLVYVKEFCSAALRCGFLS